MAHINDDALESMKESVQNFLDDFEAEILDVYLKRGYSRDTALLAFMHHVSLIIKHEGDDDDDEGEPW